MSFFKKTVKKAADSSSSMPHDAMLQEAAALVSCKATIVLERIPGSPAATFDVTDMERQSALRLFAERAIRFDRHQIASALVEASSALLEGREGDASRMLTDAIAMLRWDGKEG